VFLFVERCWQTPVLGTSVIDIEPEEKNKQNDKKVIQRQESNEISGIPSLTYNDDESSELTVSKYFIMSNEMLKYYLVDIDDTEKIIAKIKFPTDVKFVNLLKFIAKIANLF